MTRVVAIAKAVVHLKRTPHTAEELSEMCGVDSRYVRNWMRRLHKAGMVRPHKLQTELRRRGPKPILWVWIDK